MIRKVWYGSVVALVVVLGACAPEIGEPSYEAGKLDLTTYVAIGDSYAGGYIDNAVTRDGQLGAFPSLVAFSFRQLNPAQPFESPLLRSGVGLGTPIVVGGNNARYQMTRYTDCTGREVLEPAPAAPIGDTAILRDRFRVPLQNLSVPLMRVTHAADKKLAYLFNIPNYNPFYERFAPDQNTSVLDLAEQQRPTVFTAFLGAGDYLLHAVQGGANDGRAQLGSSIIPVPGLYSLTPPAVFDAAYTEVVDRLTATGAKGALATLPDIAHIPHFSTVPYDTLLLTAEEAQQLTTRYAPQGFTFQAGRNALVVTDRNGTLRRAQPTDRPVLQAMPEIKCKGLGKTEPLPHEWFLEPSEWSEIQAATQAYNQTIRRLAQAKGLALADLNLLFAQLATGGLWAEGIPFNSNFVIGGFFSLDGLHPTGRGQALIANEFIKALNTTYSANLPLVPVADKAGILFP